MRIKSSTLTGLAPPTDADSAQRPPAEPISPRAARLRETLQNGLYQVNLYRLAERLVGSAETEAPGASPPEDGRSEPDESQSEPDESQSELPAVPAPPVR